MSSKTKTLTTAAGERGSADSERERLTDNIAGTMKGLPEPLQKINVEHFAKCDPDYGKRLQIKLGLK